MNLEFQPKNIENSQNNRKGALPDFAEPKAAQQPFIQITRQSDGAVTDISPVQKPTIVENLEFNSEVDDLPILQTTRLYSDSQPLSIQILNVNQATGGEISRTLRQIIECIKESVRDYKSNCSEVFIVNTTPVTDFDATEAKEASGSAYQVLDFIEGKSETIPPVETVNKFQEIFTGSDKQNKKLDLFVAWVVNPEMLDQLFFLEKVKPGLINAITDSLQEKHLFFAVIKEWLEQVKPHENTLTSTYVDNLTELLLTIDPDSVADVVEDEGGKKPEKSKLQKLKKRLMSLATVGAISLGVNALTGNPVGKSVAEVLGNFGTKPVAVENVQGDDESFKLIRDLQKIDYEVFEGIQKDLETSSLFELVSDPDQPIGNDPKFITYKKDSGEYTFYVNEKMLPEFYKILHKHGLVSHLVGISFDTNLMFARRMGTDNTLGKNIVSVSINTLQGEFASQGFPVPSAVQSVKLYNNPVYRKLLTTLGQKFDKGETLEEFLLTNAYVNLDETSGIVSIQGVHGFEPSDPLFQKLNTFLNQNGIATRVARHNNKNINRDGGYSLVLNLK